MNSKRIQEIQKFSICFLKPMFGVIADQFESSLLKQIYGDTKMKNGCIVQKKPREKEVINWAKAIKNTPGNVIKRNGKFTISNPKMLDITEIGKDLSSENPVILIRVNNGGKCVFTALLHRTLIKKAEMLGIQAPFIYAESENYQMYLVLGKEPREKEVINWAKAIKNTPWGEKKNECVVSIGIPKI